MTTPETEPFNASPPDDTQISKPLSTAHTIPSDRLHDAAGKVPGVTVVVVGPEGVRAHGSAGWPV